jgi:hypothetical protein
VIKKAVTTALITIARNTTFCLSDFFKNKKYDHMLKIVKECMGIQYFYGGGEEYVKEVSAWLKFKFDEHLVGA